MGSKSEKAKAPRYSAEQFLDRTIEPEATEAPFDVIAKRYLRIRLDGHVWLRLGAHVAHRGDMTFTREHVIEAGHFKEIFGRDLEPLSRVDGKGTVFCCDLGKRVMVVRLRGG